MAVVGTAVVVASDGGDYWVYGLFLLFGALVIGVVAGEETDD